MDDIDVEAVDDAGAPTNTDGANDAEYVLYGGKGGVGKTTMAAATGLSSAEDGVATLVVSTDPAHSLSDTLDADVGPEPTRIREDVPLWAAEIDPEAAAGDGPFGVADEGDGLGALLGLPDDGMGGGGMGGMGVDGSGMGETGTGVDGTGGGGQSGESGAADQAGLASMPGADEAAAIRVLLEYVGDERFDRVVVDTAPTGHTLRLLDLPEAMDSMLGRVLSMRERFSGMMSNLMPGDADDEGDLEDLRELREEIEGLRAILQDPQRTDFRVVLVPEDLAVAESERLLAQLAEAGIPVETIVVNRVLQSPDAVADVAGDHVGPDHEDCAFCARRWAVQREALERAQELFRGHDVRRVPLLADEVAGQDQLTTVAACLDPEA